jgi:hypothetical protein
MGIEVTSQLIHASIAQVLHEISPEAEIFDNPNQQGTPYPAWFIVHRSPVEVRREIRRYYITYYIDIWYMIQQNITQMFDKYTRIAEQLDDKLEYVPVFGHPGVVLHTFENSWSLEMTAMKYSITLRLNCSRSGASLPKMEVIEDFQAFIKGLGKLKRIRYVCEKFPDFDMGIEALQYCEEGKSVVLPFVGGIYRDGDNRRWEPIAWSVGQFGAQYGPITDDETVNLYMGEVVGFDVVIGGTIGVGENLGKDIVWRISDMTKTPWHYVGPELVLGAEPVAGGAGLSLDAYKPIGPQKSLGPSPVYGGTVESYTPPPTEFIGYVSYSKKDNYQIQRGQTSALRDDNSNFIPFDNSKTYEFVALKMADGTDSSLGADSVGFIVEKYEGSLGPYVSFSWSGGSIYAIGNHIVYKVS